MTWQSDYWSGLKTIMAATWPELVGPPPVVRRDVAMERANWANKIKSGELKAPWSVVEIEYQPTSDWGIGPKYIVSTTIFYVVKVLDETSSTTAMTTVETKLEALRQAMMTDWTLGTTLDEVAMDTSANNPVTLTFLEQQVPYQAGSITFQTVVFAGVT